MAYYNAQGKLVAPVSSGAAGIAAAAELNDVHIPSMLAQMRLPSDNVIVCPIHVEALRADLVRLASRCPKLNAAERVEMMQAMIRYYNVSPAGAKQTMLDCAVAIEMQKFESAIKRNTIVE